MSSSSSSGSETTDFYSDIMINGVDGGVEGGEPLDWGKRIWWAVVIIAIIVLILGISIWQMESNGIISYKDPASTTALWLSKGLMIAGGVGLGLLLIAPVAYGAYVTSKKKND